jgi:hypothetical protein
LRHNALDGNAVNGRIIHSSVVRVHLPPRFTSEQPSFNRL